MSDTLSFLTHKTLPLVKTWHADGTISDYAKPKHFKLETFNFESIRELSAFLTLLEKRPNTCMIRGKYIGDTPGHTLRRKDVFEDQPLHAVMIEVDRYSSPNAYLNPLKAIDAYIENALPECFHGVSHHWQLSNSAGSPAKRDLLKAHIWFWLSTPYTSAQLKAWARNNKLDAVLDISTLDFIQIHYTGAPVFEPGAIDPVFLRSGFTEGLSDTVDLRLSPDDPAAIELARPQGAPYEGDDPTALWLEENGLAKGAGASGQVLITCPFADSHTDGAVGESDTTYLPARPGFPEGVYHCSHASCAHRESAEFESALGSAAAYFDVIPPEPDTPEKRARFDVITAGDFARRPPVEWLIKGILPKNSLSLFYGGSGDGKTFVVLDMMLALCQGASWNDRKARPARVVYICAEGSGGFVSRLQAYQISHNIKLDDVPFGVIPETPNFRDMKDVKLIAEKINAFGQADVIIIDTLAQVTPGADENTGKDMGLALRHCDELRRLTKAAVGLVHHAGKDPNKGARGWSGLKAPLDAEFEVSKEGEARKLWVEKMKDGRDGFGWTFTLETINITEDSDGDMIDSCVVKYTGRTLSPRAREKKKGEKLGKNEKLALEILETMGGGSIVYLACEEQMLKRIPQIAAGKRDKRKQRIQEAIESLQSKDFLRFENGVITLPL